jgi:hypothetical protein
MKNLNSKLLRNNSLSVTYGVVSNPVGFAFVSSYNHVFFSFERKKKHERRENIDPDYSVLQLELDPQKIILHSELKDKPLCSFMFFFPLKGKKNKEKSSTGFSAVKYSNSIREIEHLTNNRLSNANTFAHILFNP